MKIHYIIPYGIDGNYGKACNEECELIPDGDWICIKDGDMLFLNDAWGHQFQNLVETYPNTGLFTTYASRTGNTEQLYKSELSENSDIRYHRQLALKLQKEEYLNVKQLIHFISGHVMLFSKKTWQEVGGFPETLSEKTALKYKHNIASVDNRFSYKILKAGKIILLAEGIYVLHYYRLCEGRLHREHLGLIK